MLRRGPSLHNSAYSMRREPSVPIVVCDVQDGVTGPLRAERDALKERLDEVSTSLRDATAQLENVSDERDQLKFQLTRLDEKLSNKESCATCF